MSTSTAESGRPAWLGRYLRDGERGVVVTRRHAVVILEPWLSALVGLAIVGVLIVGLPGGAGPAMLVTVLWWLWFVLLLRALMITLDWSRTWFVATNKRLLLVHGFVIRKVAMMPLTKVTDMTYGRSILGRLLGYGTFVLESAGQDQALRMMDHIPDPDTAYRAIIAEIFPADASGKKAQETQTGAADDSTTRSWSPDGSWGVWPDGPVAARSGSAQPSPGDTDRLPRAEPRDDTQRFARGERSPRPGHRSDARTDGASRETAGLAGRVGRSVRRAAGEARRTLLSPSPVPYSGTLPGVSAARQAAGRSAGQQTGPVVHAPGREVPDETGVQGRGSGHADDGDTIYSSSDRIDSSSDRAPERGDSLYDDGDGSSESPNDPLGPRAR